MAVENLRSNFTEVQALQIRREERVNGNQVNIKRLHSKMMEIEIISPSRIIDITPRPKRLN